MSAVKKFVYVAISAFLLAACNADQLEFDDLEVTPIEGPFVFPLGESTYVLRDLLDKQTEGLDFEEDSTSLITFYYSDTIIYSAPDDFVQIGPIVNNGSIPANTVPAINPGPGTGSFSETFTFEYNPQNNEELDSIFYATGDLTFTTTTDIDGNLILNLDQTYSKTWYWAADRPLHAGLGPVEDDYGSGYRSPAGIHAQVGDVGINQNGIARK